MDEPTGPGRAGVPGAPDEPVLTAELSGDTLRVALAGELTEAARRPLVRELTDRLLAEPDLRRVELDLRAVPFVNSAGLAVLVQCERLTAPRAIEVVLVDPPPAVVRPLQLTGLWTRFPVLQTGS